MRCYITEKIDGTSATFINYNGNFSTCSRNFTLKEPELDGDTVKSNVWWDAANKYGLKEKLASKGNFAVQGEIAGSKIAGNKLSLVGQELFIFNVYDIDNRRYLSYVEFVKFCRDLELQTVPVLTDDFIFDHTKDQLLEMAEGYYKNTKNQREGIVIRPLIETYSPKLRGRLSVKVISNKFLLKTGE